MISEYEDSGAEIVGIRKDDYEKLIRTNENLGEELTMAKLTIEHMHMTIHDLSEGVVKLQLRLAETDAQLQRALKANTGFTSEIDYTR